MPIILRLSFSFRSRLCSSASTDILQSKVLPEVDLDEAINSEVYERDAARHRTEQNCRETFKGIPRDGEVFKAPSTAGECLTA